MFGFHGIWNGTSVLYDRGTNSHWLHLLGECIEGPLKGGRLKPIPCRHVLWIEWKRDHPDTEVMVPDPATKADYFSKESSHRGGTRLPPHFRVTVQDTDRRLGESDLLFGVVTNSDARAYPFSELGQLASGVINDTVGNIPVVILFDGRSGSAAGHQRLLDGEILEFERTRAGQLRERQSGAIFDRDGRCTAGRFQGQRLPPLHGLQADWYGWIAVHPKTTIFRSKNTR